jgi:hypothetical protein
VSGSLPASLHVDAPPPRARSVDLSSLLGAFVICLLTASSASAWVPTPNRPRERTPQKSSARYVPETSHADPGSGRAPLVAVLVRGSSELSKAGLPIGGSGAVGASGLPGYHQGHHRGSAPLDVGLLPSHRGATHLTI